MSDHQSPNLDCPIEELESPYSDYQCCVCDHVINAEQEPEQCIRCGSNEFETLASQRIAGLEATYSPEDNKLRLYAEHRLDGEIYQLIKEAGFKWAPKQDLFVTPKWTPQREDLCRRLAGEIRPEGTTLAQRAQAKADRLDAIAANRERQANAFHRAADDLSRAFEFGQPILVGHHSEGKARKTQERMHANMSKAIKARDAVSYWNYRAEGVERHANYKNRADVRARRIKTLLKDLRDSQRDLNHCAIALDIWQKAETDQAIRKLTSVGQIKTGPLCAFGSYRKLENGELDPQEMRGQLIASFKRSIASPNRRRWIEHILNRLAYERDLLGPVPRYEGELTPAILQVFAREHGTHQPKASKQTDGGFKLESSAPLPLHLANGQSLELSANDWRDLMQSVGYEVPAKKPAKAPILNFRMNEMRTARRWSDGIEILQQIELTKAEYGKIYSEARGTRLSECGQFRFKVCLDPHYKGPRYQAPWVAVFLTDSKVHTKPHSLIEAAEGAQK